MRSGQSTKAAADWFRDRANSGDGSVKPGIDCGEGGARSADFTAESAFCPGRDAGHSIVGNHAGPRLVCLRKGRRNADPRENAMLVVDRRRGWAAERSRTARRGCWSRDDSRVADIFEFAW
jgi:hypothetical protein